MTASQAQRWWRGVAEDATKIESKTPPNATLGHARWGILGAVHGRPETPRTRSPSGDVRCVMLSIALLYVAGHLVVVVVAYFFFRMLRREPNLPARREAVFELNHRPVRIEAGEAERAASVSEAATVDRRTGEVRQAVVDRVPLNDPPLTMVAYTLLGALLAELEAGVFFVLSGPVALLSLSMEGWAVAAPIFAAGWIVLLHVLIGAMVSDAHRPARTVRRAKTGAVLCGLAVIIGFWLTLSGRNITDTSVVEQLAGTGLMILAALVSLCAAFCTIVATTLLEAQHHERELARLERLHNAYTRHIELLDKDLARLHDPDLPPTSTPATPAVTAPVTATAAAPPGIVPATLVLLALLGLPHISHAQTATPTGAAVTVTTATPANTEASRASVPTFARQGACELLPDLTTSVERATFQAALAQVGTMLPRITDALHCSLIRLTPFAGDLFVTLDEIDLPQLDDADAACRTARPAPSSARSAALGLLYPSVAAARQQEAINACLAERHRAQADTLNQRRAAFGQAAERLRALGALDSRGPCTALPQAIQRALVRSQHVLVVSDGVATCTPPSTLTRVPADGHLLFLLVPPGDVGTFDRANLLLDRLNALDRLFPGARALLAPEATPSFWRQLSATK
jgi:hypothetical protein